MLEKEIAGPAAPHVRAEHRQDKGKIRNNGDGLKSQRHTKEGSPHSSTSDAVASLLQSSLALQWHWPAALKMEFKRPESTPHPSIKPRLIIHGGAGNIKPTTLTPERYHAVRQSLLGMVSRFQPW